MYKKGWDISHWAGVINYMQVAYQRPDWLAFKGSDGNYETNRYYENFDSQLLPNWFFSHMVMKTIPIDVYHWWAVARTISDNIRLTAFMLEHLDPAPNMTWLDLEEKKFGLGGGWDGIEAWLLAFPTAGVYTSAGVLDWLNKNWGKCPDRILALMASRKLWLAWYPYKLDLTKPPTAPIPWTKWNVWQCVKAVRVPGILSNVSLDVME